MDEVAARLDRMERIQKVVLSLLCDHIGVSTKSGIDPSLVMDAIYGGHYWALDMEYTGLEIPATSDHVVEEVINILDMWSFIEGGYSNLSEEDRGRVEKADQYVITKFVGFDGNNESSHFSVASFLIKKMNRFQYFAGT